MPKAPLLTTAEIERLVAGLPGWERAGDTLVKRYRFTDFREALAFVNRVAEPAERMNHHPDVAIHWNEVTLTLWTHASGGLTAKDFELARTLESLAFA